jgi:hypothetical protein
MGEAAVGGKAVIRQRLCLAITLVQTMWQVCNHLLTNYLSFL